MSRPALSALRSADIIELLCADPTSGLTLSEIAKGTGINVTSAHAVLNALAQRGYLSRKAGGKTYVLGPALITVGRAARQNQSLLAVATEYGENLRTELGTSLLINTTINNEIVTIHSSPDALGRPAPMRVGQRMPMVPPVGASFIAWSGSETAEAWLSSHSSLGDDERIGQWRQDMELIHQRGYQLTMRGLDTAAAASSSDDIAQPDIVAEGGEQSNTPLQGFDHFPAQPAAIDPETPYSVLFIFSPLFDGSGEAAFNIGLGGFPDRLSGRDVIAHAERLMATCLEIMRVDRTQTWRRNPGQTVSAQA